ncbi:MAG: TRAP transporter small permease subunit [Pseudolabrys sp.]|nr:TRAP transporter small permease subunit [Pseudolabrys sp.]
MRTWRFVDRLLGVVIGVAKWLALPLILFLFLQWPLRDIAHCCAREANDLGQWIFALFVAVSVTAATRAGTHLSTDVLAARYSPRMRDLIYRIGAAATLIPWSMFVIYASKDTVLNSVRGLEAFPDTFNPGYFIIKLALWLLAGCMILQAVLIVTRPSRRGEA